MGFDLYTKNTISGETIHKNPEKSLVYLRLLRGTEKQFWNVLGLKFPEEVPPNKDVLLSPETVLVAISYMALDMLKDPISGNFYWEQLHFLSWSLSQINKDEYITMHPWY